MKPNVGTGTRIDGRMIEEDPRNTTFCDFVLDSVVAKGGGSTTAGKDDIVEVRPGGAGVTCPVPWPSPESASASGAGSLGEACRRR